MPTHRNLILQALEEDITKAMIREEKAHEDVALLKGQLSRFTAIARGQPEKTRKAKAKSDPQQTQLPVS